MNIPTCPTCRQPRPTAIRDEVMTGARPDADQRLADAIAAAPTTKPTNRWYKHPGLAGVWLFHDECATGGRYCKPGSEERESRSDEYGLLAGTVPITYLRAREILGSAWPASWPQTDPDAPAPLPKAADADGYDYFTVKGYDIDDLWRYLPGQNNGEFLDHDGWRQSSNRRSGWGNNKDDFGPASRAACEAFLRGDKPNPDDHDDGSQSRRTGAATAAKCPGLLSTDEPKRTGAGLLPEGTDAHLPGDIAAQFAEVNRLLAQARAICEKGLAAHEAWKAGR